MGEPVSEDFYSGTDKIAGGNAPTVPVITFTASERKIEFTASIDPDTGQEVTTYFVYFYEKAPKVYYNAAFIEMLIPSTSERRFYVSMAYHGPLTLVVTGFDGYRESAVTNLNLQTVNLP